MYNAQLQCDLPSVEKIIFLVDNAHPSCKHLAQSFQAVPALDLCRKNVKGVGSEPSCERATKKKFYIFLHVYNARLNLSKNFHVKNVYIINKIYMACCIVS